MNVHEYQGKEILRKYGVATPRGIACFSVDEAVSAAEELGGSVWVVKAQIHAGGRGKGGGGAPARAPRWLSWMGSVVGIAMCSRFARRYRVR